MTHGGYREPENPAPVSGAGANSARTDGGPARPQPIRVAPGQPYGQRQSLVSAQQAAPLPDTTETPEMPGGGAVGTPQGVAPPPGPFGPSQRPGEPGNFGLSETTPGLTTADWLRAMYSVRRSPWIAAMLARLGEDV